MELWGFFSTATEKQAAFPYEENSGKGFDIPRNVFFLPWDGRERKVETLDKNRFKGWLSPADHQFLSILLLPKIK